MQRLILMRHAEAETAAASGRDEDRSLSAKGREDAVRISQALASRGFRPDHALVSPAARTRQTWDLLRDAFGDVETRFDAPLYDAGAPGLRSFVEQMEDTAGCLIVIAHNPGIHRLALDYLVEAAASPSVLERLSGFAPASAAVFSVDAAGRPGFEGYLRPDDL